MTSCPGQLAIGCEGPWFDQVSRVTRAWVQKPTESTSSPGRLALLSDGLRCRPALLGDSRSGAWFCGVDQRSRATRARLQSPTESTRCPGRFVLVLQVSQARPDVPGELGPGSICRSVDQLSWVTRSRVRRPTVLTNTPGFTRARLRWPSSSTSCPGRLGPGSDGSRGRPDLLGDSGSGPMALRVDHLSRATRTPFRGTLVSTSSPRRIALQLEGPWR